MDTLSKARLVRVAQFALGFAVIAVLWTSSTALDWDEVWANLRWVDFFLAIPLYLGILVFAAAPFVVFLRVSHPEIPSLQVMRHFFVAMCFGVFLPGSVAEALLIPVLARKGVPASHSFSAFVGAKLTSVMVMASILLAFVWIRASHWIASEFLVGAIGLAFVPFVILWMSGVRKKLRAWVARFSPAVAEGLGVFSVYFRSHKGAMVLFLVLAAAKSVFSVGFSWILLRAVGVEAPVFDVAAAVAVSALGGLIALTPQSIGVLEGGFVLFLSPYVESNQLILLSAILQRILSSSLVLVFYLATRLGGPGGRPVEIR